jgi:hypothetical protein
MRRLIKLPDGQKITKKFLCETMLMSQYETARAHYGEALLQVIEEDVPNHEPPPQAGDTSTPETILAFESVDESNAIETGLRAAKAKFRAEALSWGVRESEVDHVLQHHPLAEARNILWKARRQQGHTRLMASAAD